MTEHAAPGCRVLVISPHFDDAVLSVAGLLQQLDGPMAIVTVHGGPPPPGAPVSRWDAGCGFLSADEAYRVRLAEDARACELLGVQQVVLPNADNPYRRREHLAGLTELLNGLASDVEIYLPLGTNQPDHAAVRDQALESFRGNERRRLGIYADLPYTSAVPGWGTNRASESIAGAECGAAYRRMRAQYGLTVRNVLTLADDQWRHKRDAVLAYASQLSVVSSMEQPQDKGPMLRSDGPLRHELVWEVAIAP